MYETIRPAPRWKRRPRPDKLDQATIATSQGDRERADRAATVAAGQQALADIRASQEGAR